MFQTLVFNSHYHAYEVEETNTFAVQTPESLVDHHPLSLYQSQDPNLLHVCFVPLKYYVMNDKDYS